MTRNQLHVKHKQNVEFIWENINKSHVSRLGMWASCVLEVVIGLCQITESHSSISFSPFYPMLVIY
jgi:hypothetical protein